MIVGQWCGVSVNLRMGLGIRVGHQDLLHDARKLLFRSMPDMAQLVRAVAEQGEYVCLKPTALGHMGRKAAIEIKPVEFVGRLKNGCDQTVIAIQDGKRADLGLADQKHGTGNVVASDSCPEVRNFFMKGRRYSMPITIVNDTLGDGGNRKIAGRKFSPMCSRENPNAMQIAGPERYFKPHCSTRQFSP